MPDWISDWAPAIVVLLAVGGILWKGGIWVGAVNTELSAIRKSLDEVREDIKKLFRRLPPLPVSGGSPVRLTEFGEKIAGHLGARRWATDIAPALVSKVENQQPFEIDGFSFKDVEKELPEEWKRKVAACAYEFGIEGKGVRSVLRVVLRNELLQRVGKS